jgi:hypothetical protein
MNPIPIGELTEAVKAGTPIVVYKVKTNRLEMLTYESCDFVWVETEDGEKFRIINPTLAEAIHERCEG